MSTPQEKADYAAVVTRAADQAQEFARILGARGLRVILCPAIEIRPRPPDEELTQALSCSYEWLVLTSPNGVEALWGLQQKISGAAALPDGLKIAVQGRGTEARLRSLYGRGADLVPAAASAESLLAELTERAGGPKRIFVAAAREGREVIENGLREAGWEVEYQPLYETLAAPLSASALAEMRSVAPERLIFTFFSPSAFESVFSAFGVDDGMLGRAKLACIGPVTAAAVRARGLEVFAEARDQSAEGLAEAIFGELGRCG